MRKSRQQSAYERSIADDRSAWAAEQDQRCMWCRARVWDSVGLQIHEIERRSHAPRRWWHRCSALLLCERCHADDFASMPHARQLGVKQLRDPANYDLAAWLAIKPRPDTYVTQREVDEWAEKIRVGVR